MNCKSIMGTTVILLLIALSPAQAHHGKKHHVRPHDARTPICRLTNDGQSICNPFTQTVAVDANGNSSMAMVDAGTVIGSRPSDCPHAYCGCGLRKYLGLPDKRLNLASNWARLLPRENGPRAGLAAVRNHHVMYIEAASGNGQWLVRDYNSGNGLSRMHVRDVRGYVFVNPSSAIR